MQKPVAEPVSGNGGAEHRTRAYLTEASRRARRVRQRSRSAAKLRVLRTGLALLGVAFALLLVLGGLYTAALRARVASLSEQTATQQRALSMARDEIQQLHAERDALVSGRLPAIERLEFDVVIPIEQRYVRNIIFTATGSSQRRAYEYRIVMHNDQLHTVEPDVQLLLFDEHGIQVAASDVVEHDNRNSEPAGARPWLLQPGETRSYSGSIRASDGAGPRYFRLQIR